jgi:predicted GIY-YIG superfamily endonuclease
MDDDLKFENLRLHPPGYTVYIMEGADGSYFTGMCQDLKKEMEKANRLLIKHFNKPGRLPAKVVFKEEHLSLREATLKMRYLRNSNRVYRKKIIDTQTWPIGKMLEPLILEKIDKYLEEDASE